MMVGSVRLTRLAGPVLFVAGVAALVYAFLQNEATPNLVVIIPLITATGRWAFLGILLMVVGVFLFFLTWSGALEAAPAALPPAPPAASSPAASPSTSPRRWGGVVFLGPVPVVFGSDQKVTKWMLLVGVLLFVALLVFTVIVLRAI